MSKKLTLLIVITIICTYGILLARSKSDLGTDLISSNFVKIFRKTSPVPSPIPLTPNAPKTLQFNSSTDLKVELQKVNPQILDGDFE